MVVEEHSDRPIARILPAANTVGERAYAFFDWNIEITAMQVIQIDDIGVQPAKAVLAGLLYVFRGAINGAFSISVDDPALTSKNELIAPGRQNVAKKGLIMAQSIQAGGV